MSLRTLLAAVVVWAVTPLVHAIGPYPPSPDIVVEYFNGATGHIQAILDAARQVDPGLSPRPEDYSVANFGLVNEIYEAGEIGLVLNEITPSMKGAD